jgi:hypothetical protein
MVETPPRLHGRLTEEYLRAIAFFPLEGVQG